VAGLDAFFKPTVLILVDIGKAVAYLVFKEPLVVP
tara:strand:- start:362 stop:466 length:105 start_codon:yes stop_codon:yes gene_type:complete